MTLINGRFLRRFPALLPLVAILLLTSCGKPKPESQATAEPDGFVHWMNVGKNQYDQGQTNAITAFEKAAALQPANADAHLNLANANLLANRNEQALQAAKETLNLDPQSAAARYVAGCASMRLAKFEDAIKFLQECRDMDVKMNTVSFQLARAHQSLGHYAEAVELLQSVIQWEPEHPSAHYVLSQVLLRLGRNPEAEKEAQEHAAIKSRKTAQAVNPERCAYNEVRAPFVLEQPAAQGVKVTFADNTVAAFGGAAAGFFGPACVLDINQRGQNDLFVRFGDNSFGLLLNSNGVFYPTGSKLPGLPGAVYTRSIAGDLNNDRYEDVVAFSDKGVQIFKFATNGVFTDATAFAGMKNRGGLDGALADIDLTGKLDMLVLSPTNHEPRLLRNLGPMYFKDITVTSGIPATLTGARQIVVDDWNGDDLMDVFVAREGQPPQILIKERGGALFPTNTSASWPAGGVIAVADLNNDFRNDIVIAASNRLEVVFGGMDRKNSLPLENWPVAVLKVVDYDNDGWLDILAAGKGARVWRNLGQAGFKEVTKELALDNLKKEPVVAVSAADFDQDGDTDLLLGLASGGLQLLRNDGGNANRMLKLRLLGNRSNASGLGVRVEVKAATWRTLRTVTELPIEIGLGRNERPDAVKSYWSDLSLPVTFELKADPKTVWNVMEIELPTGSCPYLYVWDGTQFRFVTDILGASPLGLRVSDTRFVEADPEEFVSLGDDSKFRPKDGNYLVQITEELREVLYLDEAKLVVVDHPPGVKTAATCKMMPGRPFPQHEIWTLNNRHPLLRAEDQSKADVTAELMETDGQFVSPAKLRGPQLRGLAEPGSVTLDFGPLPAQRPLVLALHGWIRFGGGMANVAASHDPDLPFPFPILEVETAQNPADPATGPTVWKPVDTAVGVPCGKTKTILVDLAGKLPPDSRRLRLSAAFELHWDQIELWERDACAQTKIASVSASKTDLHWRGFSDFEKLPWYFPLTPNYGQLRQEPYWRITPSGWCTRYGPVDELIGKKDNAMVLLNGGDELTLVFPAGSLPPKQDGFVREFFLYTVGWDKDSDFHVECGTTVGPLPFHGMADQLYGKQERPAMDNDGWIEKFNTRWVGPYTLSRKKK